MNPRKRRRLRRVHRYLKAWERAVSGVERSRYLSRKLREEIIKLQDKIRTGWPHKEPT